MARYKLTHTKQDRSWPAFVGVRPGGDKRWRGVPAKTRRINALRRHEARLRIRVR